MICVAGWHLIASSETAAAEPPCVHELVYEAIFGVSMVQVEVENSQPLTFIVDSGASQTALTDPLMAEGLGLEPGGFGLSRGLGAGAKATVISKEVALRHQGVEILRTQLAVHDIGQTLLHQSGRHIDGIIGYDLFKHYVVEFEPLGGRLRLHDPETFEYRGDGWILPLAIEDRRPVVGARVVVKGDKVIPVKLMVDTGSSRTLSLLTGSRRRLKPPVETRSSTSLGITGNVDVQIGRIERLEISSITLTNAETTWVEPYRVPATRNIDGLNGILGNRFLEMFRVFFDYSGGRLILERPEQFSTIQPPLISSSD